MDPLKIHGTFDVPAAQALEAALAPTPSDSDVRVDFSHVRELHAFALAAFGEWLARAGRRVNAVGLRDHERRLLRYLGLAAHLVT